MQLRSNFVVFILTHGRPDKVVTYNTLRNNGYTGPIVLVVDNEDNTIDRYKYIYESKLNTAVYVFDKLDISKRYDTVDIDTDRRTKKTGRTTINEIN